MSGKEVKMNHAGLIGIVTEVITTLGDCIEVKKMTYGVDYIYLQFRPIHGSPDWDIEDALVEVLEEAKAKYELSYKVRMDNSKCGPGSTLTVMFT